METFKIMPKHPFEGKRSIQIHDGQAILPPYPIITTKPRKINQFHKQDPYEYANQVIRLYCNNRPNLIRLGLPLNKLEYDFRVKVKFLLL